MVRVLVILAVLLAVLSGCTQANSPAEKQEKRGASSKPGKHRRKRTNPPRRRPTPPPIDRDLLLRP